MAFKWIFLLPSLTFQVLKLWTVITECMPTVQSHPETANSRMHSLMAPNVGSRQWRYTNSHSNSPQMQLFKSNGSEWPPSIADVFQDPMSTSNSGKRLFTTWSSEGSVPNNNVGRSVPRSVFLRSKANSDVPNTGNGAFESMPSANPIFQANGAMASTGDTVSTFPLNHHLPQTGTSSFRSWSADGPHSTNGRNNWFADSINGPDSRNINNAWNSGSKNSPHSGDLNVLLSGNINNSTDSMLQKLFQGVPTINNVSNGGTTEFKTWSSGHPFSNGNSHSVPSQVFYKVSTNRNVPNADQPTLTPWSSTDSKTKQNVEHSPFGNPFPPFEHFNEGTKTKIGQEENNNINTNASVHTLQPFPYIGYQTNRGFSNSAPDTFQTMFDKLMSPSAVPASSEHFINLPESIRKRIEDKRSQQSKSTETHPPEIAYPFQHFQSGHNFANTNRRNANSQVNDIDRIFKRNPLAEFKRTHLKASSLEIQDRLKAMVTDWVGNLTAEAKQIKNKLNTTAGKTEPSTINSTNIHAHNVRTPTNTKKDNKISENNLIDFTFRPSIDTFKKRGMQNRNKPHDSKLLEVVEPTRYKSDSSSAENTILKRKTNNVIKTPRRSVDVKLSSDNAVTKSPKKISIQQDKRNLNENKVTPDVNNSLRKRKVNSEKIKTFPSSKTKRAKESRNKYRSKQSSRNILNSKIESQLSKAGEQIRKRKHNRKDIAQVLPNPLLEQKIIKSKGNVPRPSQETELHGTLPGDDKNGKLGKHVAGKRHHVRNITNHTHKPKQSNKKQNSKTNTKSKETPRRTKTLKRDSFMKRGTQNRKKTHDNKLLEGVEQTRYKIDSSSLENVILKRKANNVIKTPRRSVDVKLSIGNAVTKRPKKVSKQQDKRSLNENKVTPDVNNSLRKMKVNNEKNKTFPPRKAKRAKESRNKNRSKQSSRNLLNSQEESQITKAGKQIPKRKDNRKDITRLLPNPLLGKKTTENYENVPRPSQETEVHDTLPADEKNRNVGKYLTGKHQHVRTKHTDMPKQSDKKQNSKTNTKSKDSPRRTKSLMKEPMQNEHKKGNKSKFPKITKDTPINKTNFIGKQTDQESGTRQNSFNKDTKTTKATPDTFQDESQTPQLTNKSKEKKGRHRNTTNAITVTSKNGESQNGENRNQTINTITTTSTTRNTSNLTIAAKIKGNKTLKSNISKTSIEVFKNTTKLLPEEANGAGYKEHDSTSITTTKEKHLNTTRLHTVKVETIDHKSQTQNVSITTKATTINKTNLIAVTKEKGHKTLESNISTIRMELSTNTTHILPEQANNTERNSTQATTTNEKKRNTPITTKTTSTIVNTNDLLAVTKENIHKTSPITVESLGNSTIRLQGADYNDQNSFGFTTMKGDHPITTQLSPHLNKQSVRQNGKEINSVSSNSLDINSIKDSKSNARYSNKLPQSKAGQDSENFKSQVFETSTETYVNTNKGNSNKTPESITTASPIISALLKPKFETNNEKQKNGSKIRINDTVMNMYTTEKEHSSINQTNQKNTENKQNRTVSSTGSSNNMIHNYKTEYSLKPELQKDIGYRVYTTISTIKSTYKDPPPIVIKYTKDTTYKDVARYTTPKANFPLQTDFKVDYKKNNRYGLTTEGKGKITPDIFHLPPPPPIIFKQSTTSLPPIDPSASYLFPERKQKHLKDVKENKAVHISSLEPVKNTIELVPIFSTNNFKEERKQKLKSPLQSMILPTQNDLKHKKQISDLSNIGNSVVKSNVYDIYDVATPVKNIRQPKILAVDKKPTSEVTSTKLLEKLLTESNRNSIQLFSVPKSRYRKQRPKTVSTSKSSDSFAKRSSYTKDKDISNSKPSYGKLDKKSVPISILEMVYFGLPEIQTKKELTPQLPKLGNVKVPQENIVNFAKHDEASTSPSKTLVPDTYNTPHNGSVQNNWLQKVLHPDTKAKRNNFELMTNTSRPTAKNTVTVDYFPKSQTDITSPQYQVGKIKNETRNGINILNSLLSGNMRRDKKVQLFHISPPAYEENIANVDWKRGDISVTERPPISKLITSNQKTVNNADLSARSTNYLIRDRNVGQLQSGHKSRTSLQGPVVKSSSHTNKHPLIGEHSIRTADLSVNTRHKTTNRSPNDWFKDFNIMSGDVGNRRKKSDKVNLFGNYKNEQIFEPILRNYETTYTGSRHENLIQPENSAFMVRQNVNHISESRPNDVLRKKDLYHHSMNRALKTPVINLWDFVSHSVESPLLPQSLASETTDIKTASVNITDTSLSDGHKNSKHSFPTNIPKTSSIKTLLFPASFG